jgi:hypothetical protein
MTGRAGKVSALLQSLGTGDVQPVLAEIDDIVMLWVPRTSSTSCDQAVFVDHAADARVSSDTVLLKIDRFG